LDKLDSGLFTLQLVDLSIAFCIYFQSESDVHTIKGRVEQQFNLHNKSLVEIKAVLQEFLDSKGNAETDYDKEVDALDKKVVEHFLQLS